MVRSLFLTQSFFTLLSFVSASPIFSRDAADTDDSQHRNPFRLDPGFDIRKVVETSLVLPTHSWEFGTESEALLELYNPELSVYGKNPFGRHEFDPEDIKALVYAKEKIVIGTGANALTDGDGAVGDPASLGVFAYMLGKSDPTYAAASKEQVEYVYGGAPRWPNGAISHRADHAALWADFIYMAPPYLAYWGVVENNASTLREAVDQISLYRDVLRMNVTTNATGVPPKDHGAVGSGSWEHIIDTTWGDYGLWSTGNGWAAAGAMRVLATVIKAPKHLTDGFRDEAIASISRIVRDILDAAIRIPRADNNLLRNYIDDETWFGEISGSSALAGAAFRLSTLSQDIGLSPAEACQYADFAQDIRRTLGSGDHISNNGTAYPAINPLNWNDKQEFTQGSPEGNSFVGLLYAAWRDCVQANAPGCWR